MSVHIERERSSGDVLHLYIVDSGNRRGAVSIDFRSRCWELGWSARPRCGKVMAERGAAGEGYTGRGWRERLEADAEAALRRSLEPTRGRKTC